MDFEEWWIKYRGDDDIYDKELAHRAFVVGQDYERTRCKYPDCVENGNENYTPRCNRWLTGDCKGPNKQSSDNNKKPEL